MSASGYFNNQPYGIIREKAYIVYEKCRSQDLEFTIVKDNYRGMGNKFIKEGFRQSMGRQLRESSTEHPGTILKWFQEVHKYLFDNWRNKDEMMRKERWYGFSDVIFVEVNAILTYEVEYLLMMYIGLLGIGLPMPQLFVIIDYPTDQFKFLATDVFKIPVVDWKLPEKNPWRADYPLTRGGKNPLSIDLHPYQASTHKQGVESYAKVTIIVSNNNMYERTIKNSFTDLTELTIFEGLAGYNQDVREQQRSAKGFDFILVNSLEDILEFLRQEPRQAFKCNTLIVDEYTRMRCNAYYANNIPTPKLMHQDYLKSRIWELMSAFSDPPRDIYIYRSDIHSDNSAVIVRETFERNTINDYLTMASYKIDMFSLYNTYYKGADSRSFISNLRMNIEVLRELGYYDAPESTTIVKSVEGKMVEEKVDIKKTMEYKLSKAPQLRIHPIMVAIIDEWFNYTPKDEKAKTKRLPRMDILIFVAIASSPGDMSEQVEVRQASSREHKGAIRCEFDRRYVLYLLNIRRWGSFVHEEGKKTSECLKRLIEFYKDQLTEEDYALPDFPAFSQFFSMIITRKFSRMILTWKQHHIYRATFDVQMNWTITTTEQVPIRIFPLVVKVSRTNRHVKLYVPLD